MVYSDFKHVIYYAHTFSILVFTVTNILMENGRAVGVRVVKSRGKTSEHTDPVDIYAPVIVSAIGARNTEKLLSKEVFAKTSRFYPPGVYSDIFIDSVLFSCNTRSACVLC